MTEYAKLDPNWLAIELESVRQEIENAPSWLFRQSYEAAIKEPMANWEAVREARRKELAKEAPP